MPRFPKEPHIVVEVGEFSQPKFDPDIVRAVVADAWREVYDTFNVPREHTVTYEHTLDDVTAKNIRKAFE